MKFSTLLACLCAALASAREFPLKTADIRVRDPFIYAEKENGTYYLYAQSKNRAGSDYQGVEVYTSRNLAEWSAPKPVLKLPEAMGLQAVWAPEMHAYNGAYYLFVTLTFKSTLPIPKPVDAPNWPPMHRRGTWVYRAESPAGPFKPLATDSHTPPAIMALDGTLHLEMDGTPYMVYCHEWVELIDGAMDIIRLAPDLSATIGAPKRLFSASIAPGANQGARQSKVTDGPFLYRSPRSGALFMIWSTFLEGKGYCVLLTRSETGKALGPWGPHTPIYTTNGGHGMIFKTFEGQLKLSLHQPNSRDKERLKLLNVSDNGETLTVTE